MILYCIFGALLYIGILLRIIYRLRDIERNPQKYKEIRGWERYKKSIWYERKVQRSGPGYFACLIIGIPFFLLIPMGWYYMRVLLSVILPNFGKSGTDSVFVGLGGMASLYYTIGLFYYFLFHMHGSIFVAARVYWVNDAEWIYDGKYHLAWRHMFRWLFWCSLICLPFMVVCFIF